MTNCPLQLNADGFYQCPQCNWIYKRKTDKPPLRNCPNSPDVNTPEYREAIKQKMLAELQPRIDADQTIRNREAIAAQLDRCLEPCREFDGRVCTLRGTSCKHRKRWFEFLALSADDCRFFRAT